MPAPPKQTTTAATSAREESGDRRIILDNILPYLINRLSFRMNRLLNRDLRAHGLGISDWRVLAVLDAVGSATINELAAYAMIEQSTLSRLVMRMEKQGLVKRARTHPDGRTVTVSMTKKGRATYEKLRALSLAHAERILMGFSEAEKANLKHAVKRMTRNLERYPIVLDGSGE